MDHYSPLLIIKELLAWRAIVDILLISTGIFILYRTVRRLGSWKIVVGILVAMLVFLASYLLDLSGIKWIYINLSNVFIIALIVIFQPELRKIFERAVSVRRSELIGSSEELARMIIEVLFTLSRQRRGGIVVLPGKEPIRELISGGYPLDAKPSFPLMMSIFDPNSPGHDGGLVISGGRFTQFGVRLPVSQSSRLSNDYGTRHHAAMGLAESTDALVLVVSEERGRVSIFYKGEMIRAERPEETVNTILMHWKATSSLPFEFPRGESRRTAFSQMAASLALAFLFWSTIVVAQNEPVERMLTVPLEYSSSSSKLVLVGERQKDVQLFLGGTKSSMDAVKPSELSVKVDLTLFKPGTQSFFITNENIRLPKGVRLLEAIPSSLELTLAAITEHWATVKPQLVGSLPPGFKIESINIKPDRVKVLSPSPEGQNLIQVTTTPIYLESINKKTSIFCNIIAPQTVQPADRRWPDIEVTIGVEPPPPAD